MSNAAIFQPCAALALLTFVVMGVMYQRRIAEMRRERIAPQSFALSGEAGRLLTDTRASDNYRNLFELPVLFYVLCIALALTSNVDQVYVAGAWLFIALRAVHSAIQVGKNAVMSRFRVFAAGSLVLLALWLRFTVELLRS
jgi:hypothetical protein